VSQGNKNQFEYPASKQCPQLWTWKSDGPSFMRLRVRDVRIELLFAPEIPQKAVKLPSAMSFKNRPESKRLSTSRERHVLWNAAHARAPVPRHPSR